jgi:hypothetical protein
MPPRPKPSALDAARADTARSALESARADIYVPPAREAAGSRRAAAVGASRARAPTSAAEAAAAAAAEAEPEEEGEIDLDQIHDLDEFLAAIVDENADEEDARGRRVRDRNDDEGWGSNEESEERREARRARRLDRQHQPRSDIAQIEYHRLQAQTANRDAAQARRINEELGAAARMIEENQEAEDEIPEEEVVEDRFVARIREETRQAAAAGALEAYPVPIILARVDHTLRSAALLLGDDAKSNVDAVVPADAAHAGLYYLMAPMGRNGMQPRRLHVDFPAENPNTPYLTNALFMFYLVTMELHWLLPDYQPLNDILDDDTVKARERFFRLHRDPASHLNRATRAFRTHWENLHYTVIHLDQVIHGDVERTADDVVAARVCRSVVRDTIMGSVERMMVELGRAIRGGDPAINWIDSLITTINNVNRNVAVVYRRAHIWHMASVRRADARLEIQEMNDDTRVQARREASEGKRCYACIGGFVEDEARVECARCKRFFHLTCVLRYNTPIGDGSMCIECAGQTNIQQVQQNVQRLSNELRSCIGISERCNAERKALQDETNDPARGGVAATPFAALAALMYNREQDGRRVPEWLHEVETPDVHNRLRNGNTYKRIPHYGRHDITMRLVNFVEAVRVGKTAIDVNSTEENPIGTPADVVDEWRSISSAVNGAYTRAVQSERAAQRTAEQKAVEVKAQAQAPVAVVVRPPALRQLLATCEAYAGRVHEVWHMSHLMRGKITFLTGRLRALEQDLEAIDRVCVHAGKLRVYTPSNKEKYKGQDRAAARERRRVLAEALERRRVAIVASVDSALQHRRDEIQAKKTAVLDIMTRLRTARAVYTEALRGWRTETDAEGKVTTHIVTVSSVDREAMRRASEDLHNQAQGLVLDLQNNVRVFKLSRARRIKRAIDSGDALYKALERRLVDVLNIFITRRAAARKQGIAHKSQRTALVAQAQSALRDSAIDALNISIDNNTRHVGDLTGYIQRVQEARTAVLGGDASDAILDAIGTLEIAAGVRPDAPIPSARAPGTLSPSPPPSQQSYELVEGDEEEEDEIKSEGEAARAELEAARRRRGGIVAGGDDDEEEGGEEEAGPGTQALTDDEDEKELDEMAIELNGSETTSSSSSVVDLSVDPDDEDVDVSRASGVAEQASAELAIQSARDATGVETPQEPNEGAPPPPPPPPTRSVVSVRSVGSVSSEEELSGAREDDDEEAKRNDAAEDRAEWTAAPDAAPVPPAVPPPETSGSRPPILQPGHKRVLQDDDEEVKSRGSGEASSSPSPTPSETPRSPPPSPPVHPPSFSPSAAVAAAVGSSESDTGPWVSTARASRPRDPQPPPPVSVSSEPMSDVEEVLDSPSRPPAAAPSATEPLAPPTQAEPLPSETIASMASAARATLRNPQVVPPAPAPVPAPAPASAPPAPAPPLRRVVSIPPSPSPPSVPPPPPPRVVPSPAAPPPARPPRVVPSPAALPPPVPPRPPAPTGAGAGAPARPPTTETPSSTIRMFGPSVRTPRSGSPVVPGRRRGRAHVLTSSSSEAESDPPPRRTTPARSSGRRDRARRDDPPPPMDAAGADNDADVDGDEDAPDSEDGSDGSDSVDTRASGPRSGRRDRPADGDPSDGSSSSSSSDSNSSRSSGSSSSSSSDGGDDDSDAATPPRRGRRGPLEPDDGRIVHPSPDPSPRVPRGGGRHRRAARRPTRAPLNIAAILSFIRAAVGLSTSPTHVLAMINSPWTILHAHNREAIRRLDTALYEQVRASVLLRDPHLNERHTIRFDRQRWFVYCNTHDLFRYACANLMSQPLLNALMAVIEDLRQSTNRQFTRLCLYDAVRSMSLRTQLVQLITYKLESSYSHAGRSNALASELARAQVLEQATFMQLVATTNAVGPGHLGRTYLPDAPAPRGAGAAYVYDDPWSLYHPSVFGYAPEISFGLPPNARHF